MKKLYKRGKNGITLQYWILSSSSLSPIVW
jgi:hypothetical protein